MSKQLQVSPLTPRLGVEIRGIDVREAIGDGAAEELRSLLWKHSVLVFRNQEIEAEDQIRLVGVFGTVSDEHSDGKRFAYVSNVVEGAMLADGGLHFHSDLTYTPAPYLVISLAAVEIEGAASPTRFASLRSGYESLPAELKSRVEGLTNDHVHWHLDGSDFVKTNLQEVPRDGEYATADRYPRHTWPVVHHHHQSGEPMLYVSPWFSHINGMSEEDSESLLEQLYEHMYSAENVYDHAWTPGDVVLWDNLAVQHGRSSFRGKRAIRTLRRVMASAEGRSMMETYELAGATMPSFPEAQPGSASGCYG